LFEGIAIHPFIVQSLAVLSMLVILSILIIVHEFGHFSVARLFGFQTPVFGFGLPFGPHWTIGQKWGTEFRIHALLLGGFVLIPELGDESTLQSSLQEGSSLKLKPFRKFPVWKRALVAFAGVGFNILFAYVVMLVMFCTLGEPTQTTVVHSLIADNPIAAKAGVMVGDEVVSVNNVKVINSNDAVKKLVCHKDELIQISILRQGKPLVISMRTNASGKVGMALISPVAYRKLEGGFFKITWSAAKKLWTLTSSMIEALAQMVSNMALGSKQTGGQPSVGLQDLHGVLAVIVLGADYAQQDWSQLFLFTIMISMDLAIVNLLPIPALDGGHLAFMFCEAIRGRPMGERVQGELIKWGFICLLLLMAVVMVNDVTALFTGKLDFKGNHGKATTPENPVKQAEIKMPKTGSGESPLGEKSPSTNDLNVKAKQRSR